MTRHTTSKLAVLTAALVLALSTAAVAANNGGKNGRDGNRDNRGDRDRNVSDLWRNHENACAVGNKPPQGANCTNRDDAR